MLNPKLTLITAAAIPLVIVPISLLGKKIRITGKVEEQKIEMESRPLIEIKDRASIQVTE